MSTTTANPASLINPAARRTGPFKVGTLFSGIGAPETAWRGLGWDFRWCAEFEAFPSAVLAHHFPHVRNLGDVTKVDWNAVEPVDLLCFGSPCQSFSVAGKRLGLDDPRGNLALFALGIARQLRPDWLVFENVPGLLSSDGPRDFGAFLGLLGECGYGFAYRVLDAQRFGVPQRRRRVFVVGHLGDWRRAAAVLFERESLSGNPPPRREAGEGIAPTISARTKGDGGLGTDFDLDGGLIARCLNAHPNRSDGESETFITHSLRADGFDASEDGTGRGTPLVPVAFNSREDLVHSENVFGSLGSQHPQAQAVAFAQNQRGEVLTKDVMDALKVGGGKPGQGYPAVAFNLRGREGGAMPELSDTASLRAASGGSSRSYVQQMAVRRLMPIECERLQGFPDRYTAVTYRGKPAADGPRYKALGNSMAVPVVAWIGQRIALVESLLGEGLQTLVPASEPPAGGLSLSDQREVLALHDDKYAEGREPCVRGEQRP